MKLIASGAAIHVKATWTQEGRLNTLGSPAGGGMLSVGHILVQCLMADGTSPESLANSALFIEMDPDAVTGLRQGM
jgi:hypothetical protein